MADAVTRQVFFVSPAIPFLKAILRVGMRSWGKTYAIFMFRNFKVFGRSQLLLATGRLYAVVHRQSPSGDGSYQSGGFRFAT